MAAVAMSPPSDTDVKVEIKPALTPPTSEEADKNDESGSDLSDLEPECDDIGEIVPDHYYEGGKVPVFKPVSVFSLTKYPTSHKPALICRRHSPFI